MITLTGKVIPVGTLFPLYNIKLSLQDAGTVPLNRHYRASRVTSDYQATRPKARPQGPLGPSRVSKCQGLTVVQPHKIFPSLRKILRIVCANQKIMYFNHFFRIYYIIHTYYDILGVIFALFSCAKFQN